MQTACEQSLGRHTKSHLFCLYSFALRESEGVLFVFNSLTPKALFLKKEKKVLGNGVGPQHGHLVGFQRKLLLQVHVLY